MSNRSFYRFGSGSGSCITAQPGSAPRDKKEIVEFTTAFGVGSVSAKGKRAVHLTALTYISERVHFLD